MLVQNYDIGLVGLGDGEGAFGDCDTRLLLRHTDGCGLKWAFYGLEIISDGSVMIRKMISVREKEDGLSGFASCPLIRVQHFSKHLLPTWENV